MCIETAGTHSYQLKDKLQMTQNANDRVRLSFELYFVLVFCDFAGKPEH